ncbi:MAG: DUF624 domain-containing protein [Turicibacter sp.]|nr:DUF624 domain-containing protein [Turicibacter sp.]
MINIFDTDGFLYKIGMVLADIFLLNFLWLIFSLPLITIGASTTAVYYVTTKKVGNSDAYVLKGFLKSFKENFLVSTIAYVILAAIGLVVWVNFRAMGHVDLGGMQFPVRVALSFVLIQIIFVSMYVFPIISRFDMTAIKALKSALQLSNGHLFLTISNLVLLVAVGIVTIWIPFLFVFIPGIFAYLSANLYVRIFRKYDENFE